MGQEKRSALDFWPFTLADTLPPITQRQEKRETVSRLPTDY